MKFFHPLRHLQFIFFFFALLVRATPVVYHSTTSPKYPSSPQFFSAQEPFWKASYRLAKPLIGDDGRVYACSYRHLFAFESNGSIAWIMPLNYTCNAGIAPVLGGAKKIYLVAENKVLKINSMNVGTAEPAAEVFFGPGTDAEGAGEIIGISVSTLCSCVLINVKNRALFAYRLHGKLLWSAGPVLNQSGYRQGCRRNTTRCYFSSAPVIDQCEATIYISNSEGELYAMSVRSPYFKWVQDFSSFDKLFTITPGNNGRLYVTVPVKALVLAVDVSTGNVLWQRSIGPLSTSDCAPVVDSNGWISIGSLDGFLYSFSATGFLKKFPQAYAMDSVVQVAPLLDCSGFAVYISQTEMEGKISRTIGEYTYISAMKPKRVVFTMLVPATGTVYWSESYPGQFLSLLLESDLQYFVLDERILLAFVRASKFGSPLPCRSSAQKLVSSCSQMRPKNVSVYTGNEREITMFLLFESAILVALAALVRFCRAFWRKKKLQGQDLGKFLEKRRSLRLQKKAVDRTITELQQNTAEEVIERLSDLVKEREGIERKLSTTYSLGRDTATTSRSKSLISSKNDAKSTSFSFQSAKKESVTLFHTLTDTSSEAGSSDEGDMFVEDKESAAKRKGKAKAKEGCEVDRSSDEWDSSSPGSGSRGYMNPLFMEQSFEDAMMESGGSSNRSRSRSIRRRTMSPT